MWKQQVGYFGPESSKRLLVGILVLGSVAFWCIGCSSRTLTITQTDRVNNAMHHNRHPDQRTGDPLEVTIVSVNSDDLEREGNGGLKPGSGITCKGWYDNRPVRGSSEGRFDLPPEQIFLLTNANEVYGTKLGPALNGAIKDGRTDVMIKGIPIPSWMKLHSRDSVIYVFPKFIGPNGTVLPVGAAEFSPPGAYSNQLHVKIGVDEGREHYGQYIERVSER